MTSFNHLTGFCDSAGKAVGQQSGNPAAAQRRTRKRRRGVDSQKEVTVGLPDYVKPALDILFVSSVYRNLCGVGGSRSMKSTRV